METEFRRVVDATVPSQAGQQRLTPAQWRRLCIEEHNRGRYREAVEGYQSYLRGQPNDAAIWCNLGAALRKLKHYQSAVNCYRHALELAPADLAATGNLANALKDLHRLDEAILLHQQVVTAKPDDIQVRVNYACALREAGRFGEALAQLDRARMVAPGDAGLEWERAQNLLYLGRYIEGWIAYEARWRTGELPVKDYGCARWNGKEITGKTILLHAEQGYGDTILAARFIPLVKQRVGQGGRVILVCKPELHRLFEQVGADELIAPDATPPTADRHCPLMSLMGVFDTVPVTIPPPARLHVPDASRRRFAYLGGEHPGCLKVGIVWSGSLTFAGNANRAVALDRFLPLAEQPGLRLYSLQKGPRQRDLQDTGAAGYIPDLGRLCDDFADTAAAIEQLDLIVMTDSSVAHLAGSLGKPVINLLQKVPYWLYALGEGETPWYPSMRMVKQRERNEWGFVFEKVLGALLDLRTHAF